MAEDDRLWPQTYSSAVCAHICSTARGQWPAVCTWRTEPGASSARVELPLQLKMIVLQAKCQESEVRDSRLTLPGWSHALLTVPVIPSVLITLKSVPPADTTLLDCRVLYSGAFQTSPAWDLQISTQFRVSRVHSLYLCSVPLPLNYPTIPPVGQARNVGHPWLFPPLHFWLTMSCRIWSLLSPRARSQDRPPGSWATQKAPHSHLPAHFHSVLSPPPSALELLSHSRLKSLISGVLAWPLPVWIWGAPVLLLTWHSSCRAVALAMGGPCLLLPPLHWALGLTRNRCSANICD